MRLPSLIAFAGLLLLAAAVVPKIAAERSQSGDLAALADRWQATAHEAHAAFDHEAAALAETKAGLSCLAGTGVCPGGARNPFGR